MKGRVARGVGGGECDAGTGRGSDAVDGRAGVDGHAGVDGRAGVDESCNDSVGATGEEPSDQIPPDRHEEAVQKPTNAEGEKGKMPRCKQCTRYYLVG